MRQVLQSYRSGELWLADVPVPSVDANGALVSTSHSLVSAGTERMLMELAKKSLLGKARARPDLVKKVLRKVRTDGLKGTLEQVFAKLDTPIALGYSCSGTVVEVGRRVDDLAPGDRVACGGAGWATHAEWNAVPKNLVVRIPDGVTDEDAAFATVGAIAMQGVRQAELRVGERAVVTGLGLLGLLTVQILVASGVRVVGCDPDPERCERARAAGAVAAGAPGAAIVETALATSGGHGVDAVLLTAASSSNEPLEQAAAMLRSRGRAVVVGVVGMDVPRDVFYRKELELRLSMSYGPGRYDRAYEELGQDYPYDLVRWTERRNMQCFLELVETGAVRPSELVTHRFDVDDALNAYALMNGDEAYLGITIAYPAGAGRRQVPERGVELAPARAPHPRATVGVGLIGAGSFTRGVLLPKLERVDGVQLIGVCTAGGTSAAETGRRSGFELATSDPDTLLRDARIDAAIVTTRHDTHADLCVRALEAGKHVFVEKPPCLDVAELARLEAAVRSAAATNVFTVGYNRRFSPHATAVREAIAARSGPLAIGYRVNAGSVPRDTWIQDVDVGGGRIVGEVCHFVDLCRSWVGKPVVSVFAAAARSVRSDVRRVDDDTLSIVLRYDDGSLATIQYVAVGSSQLRKERVEVHWDGCSAVVDDFVATRFHGLRRAPVKGPQNKGFAAELDAFVESIRSGSSDGRSAAPIPWDEIAETSRVTFAAVASLRTGRPIDPGEVESAALEADADRGVDAGAAAAEGA